MSLYTGKRIEDFLESLRSPALPVSTQQIIAAYQLLLELKERGEWPDNLERFAFLLAPVLCSSPAEQQEFQRRFEEWLVLGRPVPPPPPPPIHLERIQDSERARINLKWILTLFVFIALLAASYEIWLHLHRIQSPAPRSVASFSGRVLGPDRLPIKDATVRYRGKTDHTDSNGKFSIPYQSKDVPFYLLITNGYWNPVLLTVDANTPAAQDISLSPRQGVEFVPGSRIWSEQWVYTRFVQWVIDHVAVILKIVFLLPLLLAVGSVIWKGRSVFLQKWSTPLEPRLRRFGTERPHHKLYRHGAVQRIGTELSRHQRRPSRDLDVGQTIDQTLRQGGFFTPVFGNRQTRPEYLCLVQQLSNGDHYTSLHNEMLDRLETSGVQIDRYYYTNDPRLCWPMTRSGSRRGFRSLQELAAVYPGHHLFMFGDAEAFIDSASLTLNPTAELLQYWTVSAVFDTPAISRFPEQCDFLRSTGVRMLEDNLESLSQATGRHEPGTALLHDDRPFPDLLQELPERWLDLESPNAPTVEKLNAQLRIYLDEDGYRCLQACAVYPGVIWDLTVFWAQQFSQGERTELILGKLAHLPWFRHAAMPDWLRRRLLRNMPGQLRDFIKEALDRFLESVKADEQAGALDIAEQVHGATPKSGRPTALKDYVFASFILGQSMDQLSVSVPDRFRRLLARQMNYAASTGWDLATALMLFSAAAYFIFTCVGIIFLFIANKSMVRQMIPIDQPGTLKVVQFDYKPPDDFRLATIIDVAAAQVGQQWSGSTSFAQQVVMSSTELMTGNNSSDGKLLLTGTSVVNLSTIIQPGMVSFGQNGVVESVTGDKTSYTLIMPAAPGSTVERVSLPLTSGTDFWDIRNKRDYVAKTGPQIIGRIEGLIFDESKKPIPNAQVRVIAMAGIGSIASTDSTGHFVLSNLPSGIYTVQITATGYVTTTTALVLTGTSSHQNFILLAQRLQTPSDQQPAHPPTVEPPELLVTPRNVDFGSVLVGSPKSLAVEILNPVAAFDGIDVAYDNSLSAFKISNSCPSGLVARPPEKCTLTVTFTPQAPGDSRGSLDVVGHYGSAAVHVTVTLSGMGFVGPGVDPRFMVSRSQFSEGQTSHDQKLLTAPSAWEAGKVVVGASQSISFTISSPDGGLDFDRISLQSNPGSQFQISDTTCKPKMHLDKDGSCVVRVSFSPSSHGAFSDQLEIIASYVTIESFIHPSDKRPVQHTVSSTIKLSGTGE